MIGVRHANHQPAVHLNFPLRFQIWYGYNKVITLLLL